MVGQVPATADRGMVEDHNDLYLYLQIFHSEVSKLFQGLAPHFGLGIETICESGC